MDGKTPIVEAGRIFKTYAGRLEKLGIVNLEDFLSHVPFRYENFALVSKIGQLQIGEAVTIEGTVLSIKNEFTRRFKKIQKATVVDETGSIDLIWFNQPYLTKYIQIHDKLSLSGTVKKFGSQKVLESPEYEILQGENPPIHTGRIVPVYPETRGISSKWLRRQIYKLLQDEAQLEEFLPPEFVTKYGLLQLSTALKEVHFPTTFEYARRARERLAFDELLILQLAAIHRRSLWSTQLIGNPFEIDAEKNEAFISSLPFALTNAQVRAVGDIIKDISAKKPMNRLLQGDVGSGKTVVSAIAIYQAYLNGFQSVLLAPTEILAQQHFSTLSTLLNPFGITVDLLTGSNKQAVKKTKTEDKRLKTHVLVGTHAVLSEKIQFENLGLVVIDEQQRFGVEQRSMIREKGNNPHVLTMTATPIPRTVALTLYGDLDLTYLDEMPKGRRMIKTWLVPQEKRDAAYDWIRKEITTQKSQVFIICPFIEESETMVTIKAATKEFEYLRKDVFSDLQLGMLHGKMKAKEKEQVLQDFKEKKFDILVATPVVEVGIDISNATVIVIEAAERFGLAQLHQLRGRVGRGEKQSYCLLFTETKSEQTTKRLKAMETMHVGAELAELDLQLRGPGELYGTLQSGAKQLKIASFSDVQLIEKTRKGADELFPKLSEQPKLQDRLAEMMKNTISPD